MSGQRGTPDAGGPGDPPPLEWQGGASTRLSRYWLEGRPATGGWLGALLAPAELAFRVGSRGYHAPWDAGLRRAERVGVPVVSIGNLAVGGSGKTPVTAWAAGVLARAGFQPAILHGGYAADEPALHRLWRPDIPVIALRDRVAAAKQAIARGATALVLDDAFQHRRIARDLDIVLVAAERWTPRPRLLPRGPWREPLSALRRATAVVVTRKAASPALAARIADTLAHHAPGASISVVALRPAGWIEWRTGERRAAPPAGVGVAGVADPSIFAVQAQQAGARFSRVLAYPDHHGYDAADAARIATAAVDGVVLTTAKDAVKLQAVAADAEIWVLDQEVVPERGADGLVRALEALKR